MLTPADIKNKQFKAVRLKEGYDQDEVDGFLDRIEEDYGFLQATVARLEEDNRNLRRQVQARSEAPTMAQAVAAPPPSAVAEKLLAAAEKAGAEHVAEAKAEADRIVREAGGQGARIVEEATEAAERIKSEGLTEKYRRNEELDAQIRFREQQLATIKQSGDQARRALYAAVAAYDKESN